MTPKQAQMVLSDPSQYDEADLAAAEEVMDAEREHYYATHTMSGMEC